VRPLAVVGC